MAPTIYNYVCRLDVPMDDVRAVRRVQGISNLDSDTQYLVGSQRPVSDPVGQRLAFEQLHDDVGLIFVLSDVVDRADVGMIQGRGGPGLSFESVERRSVTH